MSALRFPIPYLLGYPIYAWWTCPAGILASQPTLPPLTTMRPAALPIASLSAPKRATCVKACAAHCGNWPSTRCQSLWSSPNPTKNHPRMSRPWPSRFTTKLWLSRGNNLSPQSRCQPAKTSLMNSLMHWFGLNKTQKRFSLATSPRPWCPSSLASVLT